MSYIHDALRKAQREKDIIAGKYGSILSTYRYRRDIFKRKWVVAASLILVCIAVSAYSWLYFDLPLISHRKANVAGHRTAISRHGRPEPEKPPGPGSVQAASKSVAVRGTRETSKPRSPAASTNPPLAGIPGKGTEARRQAVSVAPNDTLLPHSQGLRAKEKSTNRVLPSPKSMTLYDQAVALQKEGRLQEAKKLYEAALGRSPNLVSALNNLGAICIQEKDYATARRVLEKAVKMEPDYVDPYYNLACLHALQRDVGQSLSNLRKAVYLDEAVRMWARTDKDLENLRGHSEYEKIIRKTTSP